MNIKRYLLASLLAFITLEVTNFVIHGMLLTADYESLKGIWNPDMMKLMWLMNVKDAITALIIVYIFTKGYENRGVAEGIRFGFWVGMLLWIGGAVSTWVNFPIPLSMAVKWFIYGVFQMMLVGMVIALIYRPKTT